MPDFDLTTLQGLLDALAAYEKAWLRNRPAVLERGSMEPAQADADAPHAGDELGDFTGTYCVRCAGSRRMRLVARSDRCV